jgi:xanthine dehydrogenase YagR molybdenum-binding subunit
MAHSRILAAGPLFSVNPVGVKGMGELGMVGIPAAIANAVFPATGRRVRDLPITPDKLL